MKKLFIALIIALMSISVVSAIPTTRADPGSISYTRTLGHNNYVGANGFTVLTGNTIANGAVKYQKTTMPNRRSYSRIVGSFNRKQITGRATASGGRFVTKPRNRNIIKKRPQRSYLGTVTGAHVWGKYTRVKPPRPRPTASKRLVVSNWYRSGAYSPY